MFSSTSACLHLEDQGDTKHDRRSAESNMLQQPGARSSLDEAPHNIIS
jgi:hypothetical protein